MTGRPCGPCGDKTRNELDRRLLEMEITGETYRALSRKYGYSEDALRRHRMNHLTVDLTAVRRSMDEAREKALAEVHEREMEAIRNNAINSTAARLENAASFFDQLKEIRSRSASLLDQAEEAQDLRAAGTLLRELREQIRLMAEIEGRLASQPQINILINPQWIELRTLIIKALEPYPEAREAIIHAIHE